MNKKILFVTPIYAPSKLPGSSVFVKEISERLANEGFDVSVVTSKALTARYWYDPIFGKKINKKYELINKVKVYRLPSNFLISIFFWVLLKFFSFLFSKRILDKIKLLSNGPYLLGLKKFLKNNSFDVIHVSPFPLNIVDQLSNIKCSLKLTSKLLVTPFFHPEIDFYDNIYFKKIFERFDLIHTVSNYESYYLTNFFNIPKEKIVKIPLFIDIKKLHSIDSIFDNVKKFKEKHFLNNKRIILFAGNKGYDKGAITSLLAINDLHKLDSKFILIAIGNESKEWTYSKKLINKDCLIDFNYVTGLQKEIIFSSCDLFCMPSRSESFGIVYLEAWHKKKPVIGSDIPAIKELIKNGGLLIPFDNREKLKETIKKLFDSPDKLKKLGVNGYKRLMNNFTLDNLFNQYKKLFE